MTDNWQFAQPGRFTVGTVGEPGSRVFYFQAFAEGTEVAVKCEKQQALALAEHLVGLLADLPGGDPGAVPAADALPPSDLRWSVGSISIGVDRESSKLVVLLEELVLDEEDDTPVDREPNRMRVHLTAEQVRAYAGQVEALSASGRPICRLCDQPMDPDGHACPRLN